MISTTVIVVPTLSLLAFAVVMFSGVSRTPEPRAHQPARGHTPVLANLTACGMFFLSLALFRGRSEGPLALSLAFLGLLTAGLGVTLVLRSRAALGSAWSLVPRAEQDRGFVTSGPYRLVRHPIYLGLSLLGMGQALAFASWPALALLVVGIVPSFAWRAWAEERLLSVTFGERYAAYEQRTKLIIPRLL